MAHKAVRRLPLARLAEGSRARSSRRRPTFGSVLGLGCGNFFGPVLGLASRRQFPPNPRVQQRLGYISLLVRDYDEAIAYYTSVLGFRLVEDTPLAPGKRWILVMPPGPDAAAGGLCRRRRRLRPAGR